LVGLPAGPIGYAIAAGGVIAILTGFFGFCPMCAMVGRKLPSPDSFVQRAVKRSFRGIFVKVRVQMPCCRKLGKRVAKVSRNDLEIPAR
jgi:hypothetical protein